MSFNFVMISGNLTRDPELRLTAGGTQVLSFTVAVNDRRKNPQTGEWEESPNFVGCVMFGRRAEAISRYLAKGSKVCLKGSLRYSTWERDGQKRSKLEVVVDDIEFMSSRGMTAGATDRTVTGSGGYEGDPQPDDGQSFNPEYEQPRSIASKHLLADNDPTFSLDNAVFHEHPLAEVYDSYYTDAHGTRHYYDSTVDCGDGDD